MEPSGLGLVGAVMTQARTRLALTTAALLGVSGLTATTSATSTAAPGSTPPMDTTAVVADGPVVPTADPGAPALARAHVLEHREDYGLDLAEVRSMTVSSLVPFGDGGSVVYLQQRVNDLDLQGAMLNVAVTSDGVVAHVASSAVAGATKRAGEVTPTISASAAARAAADALGLEATTSFAGLSSATGVERARTLRTGGIAAAPIPARLVYATTKGGDVRLAWELGIEQLDSEHWWQIRMDAESGSVIDKADWVAADSYVVYPLPTEAPSFGGRASVVNPADATASPFGWHDLDGNPGAETQTTAGNNVNAYTDVDNDNVLDPGSQPDGGPARVFEFPLDLGQAPSTYKEASVTNLFHLTNWAHDTFYRFGFTEEAGNFQRNNYNRGGLGNDRLNAEAQNGGGSSNANFTTPADGTSPRMQMYLWTPADPDRDGALDAGVVLHEYSHGVTSRLAGGPANASCLNSVENGTEGWSDWFGLMLTLPSGVEQAGGQGIGTYALGQDPTGPGIRSAKYSTDQAINSSSYDSIKFVGGLHRFGEVWAEMLWEVSWALIAEHGYATDLIAGNGGNTVALQLVLDGLKLQPCDSGFVDARDAILAADELTNAGQNSCLLWKAFAKRGLGFSAIQGSAGSVKDGTEAFDLPAACGPLALVRTATPDPVGGGRDITYGFELTNGSDTPNTGVVLTSDLGDNSTYVRGSATCGGVYDGITHRVSFPATSLPAAGVRRCSYAATAAEAPLSAVIMEDGFEPDLSRWTTTHGAGTTDWSLTTTTPASPPYAAFAANVPTVADKYLTVTTPVSVPVNGRLSFQNKYMMESGFDGGVVEISTTGGASWLDLGPAFVENGYSGTINGSSGSPIGGRSAFTGTSPGGYLTSVADLTSYAGQSVLLRFRQASDNGVGSNGWWIDDVVVEREVSVTNSAAIDSDRTGPETQVVQTKVIGTAPASPTVDSSRPTGPTTASVAFTPGGTGGAAASDFGVRCESSDGGATRTAGGPESPLSVTGLSAGKRYRCRANATNTFGVGEFGDLGPAFVQSAAPAAPTVKKQKQTAPRSLKVVLKPGADGGSKVTQYVVQCVAKKKKGATKTAKSKRSRVVVKKLSKGKRYHCRAKAKTAVGSSPYGPFGAYVTLKK